LRRTSVEVKALKYEVATRISKDSVSKVSRETGVTKTTIYGWMIEDDLVKSQVKRT
jgi:transposase-like protein